MWGAKNIYKRTYSLPIEYNARGRFIIVNMFRHNKKPFDWKKEFLKQFSEEDTTEAATICDTEYAEGQKTSPSKSEKKRARRTRIKRGRPLTSFANNEEALQKKEVMHCYS